MSRSGYTDACEGWDLIRWRGAVRAAIRGHRGQAFLKEMLAALDAMPNKRLIASNLITFDGEVCAMGALGRTRGLNMRAINPDDRQQVADLMGVAPALAAEIAYENDEYWQPETPEQRFTRMRNWVMEQIAPEERADD
jgi:hypothetical protein